MNYLLLQLQYSNWGTWKKTIQSQRIWKQKIFKFFATDQ